MNHKKMLIEKVILMLQGEALVLLNVKEQKYDRLPIGVKKYDNWIVERITHHQHIYQGYTDLPAIMRAFLGPSPPMTKKDIVYMLNKGVPMYELAYHYHLSITKMKKTLKELQIEVPKPVVFKINEYLSGESRHTCSHVIGITIQLYHKYWMNQKDVATIVELPLTRVRQILREYVRPIILNAKIAKYRRVCETLPDLKDYVMYDLKRMDKLPVWYNLIDWTKPEDNPWKLKGTIQTKPLFQNQPFETVRKINPKSKNEPQEDQEALSSPGDSGSKFFDLTDL